VLKELRGWLKDKRRKERRTMWLIYLEAGIALTLVLVIVYWTMRGKK
jgi:predicted nucleic acid-binding Zn ribbon protein